MEFNINDATSDTDRVESDAMALPPFGFGPQGAISVADYLARTPDSDILSGWKSQIRRLEELAQACGPMQSDDADNP